MPELTGTEASSTVGAGRVLRQDPAPGTTVDAGTAVAYVLSTGPELVAVPDVEGQSQQDAADAVEAAGLAVGALRDVESDAVAAGAVDEQRPRAGQLVRPGTAVDLDVALGRVNDAPHITTDPTTSHLADGSAWTYDADATDADGVAPDDAGGDTLTWSLQAGPDGATIDPSTGVVAWTPEVGDAGAHDLAVRVDDGAGGLDVQSFTLTVTVPNRAPTAVDDLLDATVGQPRVIDAPELTDNDTDADGDALAIASYGQPQTGTLTQTGPQQLTYTPNQPDSTDVRKDIELTNALPVTVTTDASTNTSYPLARLVDGYHTTDWVTVSGQRAPVGVTFTFDTDVDLRRLDLYGARSHGQSGHDVKEFTVEVRDAADATLFGPTTYTMPDDPDPSDGADPDGFFDLGADNGGAPITGARSVVVTITQVGSKLYPMLTEIDLWGDAVPELFAPRPKWIHGEFTAYSGPAAADLDRDGVAEVLVTRASNRITAFDGATGEEKWTRQDVYAQSQTPVIGDVVGCEWTGAPAECEDDQLEVVYVGNDTSFIRVVDAFGNLIAEAETNMSKTEGNLVLADVDGDGDAEVIGGSSRLQIIDIDPTTGVPSVRATTAPSGACGNNSYRSVCVPVVADIDVDGELEIITGQYVFDAATGATEQHGAGLTDAFVGVANFDDDPEGEIVLVDLGKLHIVNHDFTTVFGPVPLAVSGSSATGYGGPPTIGDFDADGSPEIGIAGARAYAVYDPTLPLSDPPVSGDAVLWQAETFDGSSHRTGSTLFDFDDDGSPEVVYGSERNLWIWDGPTGAVRWSRPISSGTTIEQPIVADVDGDQQAELVVHVPSARTVDGITHPKGLTVYDAPADNWVRARAIWNQHAYSVTHVNSDGSIPRVPDVNWLDGALNNFRQQSFPSNDTSRLDRFTYTVEDPDGAPSTATAFVDARPPQNAPAVTCLPSSGATVGVPYAGRVCATDVDGDDLTFHGALGFETNVDVPGSASPYLADQPDGTTIGTGAAQDAAPAEAPPILDLGGATAGTVLRFDVAGTVDWDGPTDQTVTPDGWFVRDPSTNDVRAPVQGDEHGIGDVVGAPMGSFVGVFLTDDTPADGDPLPPAPDFSTPAQRQQASYAPAIRQPFFVGDGLDGSGTRQEFVVPDGATRLALAVYESEKWNDNTGGYTVRVLVDAGFTMDPATGVVRGTPTETGRVRLVGAVDDGTGRATPFSSVIDVREPVTVPDLLGLEEAAARTAVTDVDLVVGVVGEAHSVTVPAGDVLSQWPPAGAAVAQGRRVTFTVSSGPSPADTDADGDGYTPNEGDCLDDPDEPLAPDVHPDATETDNDGIDSDCDGEDGGLDVQDVGIVGADNDLVVGRTRSFAARARLADGRLVDITDLATFDTTDAGIATIDGRTITAVAPGGFGVTASFAGFTAQKDLTAIAGVAADELPPVAEITAPAPGDEVGSEVEVTGTATDANLIGWSLTAVDDDGEELAAIAEGTTPVDDGVLGTFAAAAVPAGIVSLRLDVEDAGGNISRVDVPVQVLEGPQPGAFSLSFTDVTVPMSGLPLSVVRTYDSRDRTEGDFGAAWRLDITGLDVRVGRDQGAGWELIPGRFASTALQPTRDHAVTITLPTGRQEVFDLLPSPRVSSFVPLTFTQAAYRPRRGTTGTLVPTGNRNLLVLQGASGVELVDDGTLETYEPTGFVYTRQDGTAFTVDASGAVSRIEDPNGNVVTIDETGITHSGGRSVTFTRDALGRITAVTDPEGNAQTYRYSAAGDLAAHTDREGNTTTFAYDAGHYLTKIVDPLGRPLARMEYDAQGRLVASTDPEGRRVEIDHDTASSLEVIHNPDASQRVVAYDAHGNIVSETDELGRTTTRTFDADDHPTSVTDALGHTTTFDYDADGLEISRTNAEGETTTYTRDADGRVLSVSDDDGRTTSFTRDAAGNVLTQTDPTGAITRWSYDAAGNAQTRTDANGRTTRFTHDAAGGLVGVVDPTGREVAVTNDRRGNPTSVVLHGATGDRTLSLVYDRGGLVTGVTDPAGVSSSRTYDGAGELVRQVDEEGRGMHFTYGDDARPTGAVLADGTPLPTTYDVRGRADTTTSVHGAEQWLTHDAAGQITGYTRPGGTTGDPADDPVTTLGYDAAGRLSTVGAAGDAASLLYDDADRIAGHVDPLGHATSQTLDAAGRVVAETDPLGRTTTYDRDGLGRLLATHFPDGTSTSATYDGAGDQLTYTDENGATTSFEYDAAGRIVAATDPAGSVTRYGWTELDQVAWTRDALDRTTRYRYDSLGRLVEVIRPSGARESREYDRSGLLVARTDGNGDRTQITYDDLRRPVRIQRPDGTEVAYAYADAGTVPTSITDARGTTTQVLDERGRVTARTEPDGRTISYEYDGHDRLAAVTTPGGRTDYTMDAAGRTTSVTDPSGTTTLAYDAVGNLITTTLPNGVVETRTYDTRDRVTSIEASGPSGAVTDLTYTYSPAGRVATATDAVAATTTTYGYDAAGRLTDVTIVGGGQDRTTTFTYDAVGNRLTVDDSVDGTTAATYDVDDRLVSEDVAGVVATFAYDGAGNRLSRTAGSTQDLYGWDTDGRLVSVVHRDAGGTTTTRHGYAPDGLLAVTTAGGTTTRYLQARTAPFAEVAETSAPDGTVLSRSLLAAGDRLATTAPAGTTFLHGDQLGSVVAVTDDAGSVVDMTAYAPYGQPRSGATTAFGFTGELQDPTTGLVQLRQRWLDPATGQFLSADPVFGTPDVPASLHDYTYATDDPVNVLDPSGLSPTLTEVAVGMMIIAGGLAIVQGVLGAITPGERVLWAGTTVDVSGEGTYGTSMGLTVANYSAAARGFKTDAIHVMLYLSEGIDLMGKLAKRGKGDYHAGRKGAAARTRANAYWWSEFAGNLVPVDVEIGDATIATPSILGGRNGLEPDVLNGFYLNAGISATGGAMLAAVKKALGGTTTNSYGAGVVFQGYGLGYSVPDTAANFGALPNIGAAVKAGVSINLTPEGRVNQPGVP